MFNLLIDKGYITYNKDIQINGIKIKLQYELKKRERGSIINMYNLKYLCRKYKLKGYSNKKKKDLIDFIINKSIYISSIIELKHKLSEILNI